MPAVALPLIEKLCAKDPADRTANANAVIEDVNSDGSFAIRSRPAETQKSYIMSPRFYGRSAELERVTSFVLQAARRPGRRAPALWVRGVSGIGKSRLMKEVRQAAQLQRLVFIEGNCYENSLVEDGPLAEVLSQLVPVIEIMGGLDIVRRRAPRARQDTPRARQRTLASTPLPKAATVEGERVQLLTMTAEFSCAPPSAYRSSWTRTTCSGRAADRPRCSLSSRSAPATMKPSVNASAWRSSAAIGATRLKAARSRPPPRPCAAAGWRSASSSHRSTPTK